MWKRQAACADQPTRQFFDAGEADDGERWEDTELALARSFCWRCPVATECFEAAMEEEDGQLPRFRYGVRGGLTGAQRGSLWRRGPDEWRCPNCGEAYAPRSLMVGSQVCSCGLVGTVIRSVSDRGDEWAERHTRLAAEVRLWLRDYAGGDPVPGPTAYALEHGIRKDDVARVYRALIEDGVLEQVKRGRYRRV